MLHWNVLYLLRTFTAVYIYQGLYRYPLRSIGEHTSIQPDIAAVWRTCESA